MEGFDKKIPVYPIASGIVSIKSKDLQALLDHIDMLTASANLHEQRITVLEEQVVKLTDNVSRLAFILEEVYEKT